MGFNRRVVGRPPPVLDITKTSGPLRRLQRRRYTTGDLTGRVPFAKQLRMYQAYRGRVMAGMWARLRADLNVKLRRGAWYRITRLDPLQTVLEVGGRLLEVPSAFLQVIERPPRKWSVVARPTDAVRLPEGCAERYAVCPSCRQRQSLAGRPRRMSCRRCGEDFEVAWSERG